MNVLWAVGIPVVVVAVLGIARWIIDLRFFNVRARDLDDVLTELTPVDIEDFKHAVSREIDEALVGDVALSISDRTRAYRRKLELTREWLATMISNATVLQQVGRFRTRWIRQATFERVTETEQLECRLMEAAIVCHLLGVLCSGKLRILEISKAAWPLYVPPVGKISKVRRYDLVWWYEELVNTALELARRDKRWWLYDNLSFVLTGVAEWDPESEPA
jgi:hypothetical protein